MQPDVILLDYAMAGLDGAQISRRLRGEPATAAIPFVLMSAQPATARPRLSVDDELPKRFDLGTLVATVERGTAARPHDDEQQTRARTARRGDEAHGGFRAHPVE